MSLLIEKGKEVNYRVQTKFNIPTKQLKGTSSGDWYSQSRVNLLVAPIILRVIIQKSSCDEKPNLNQLESYIKIKTRKKLNGY